MSQSSPSDKVSFEDAMARLEEIVTQMDGEELPLDEMVKSYEEGVKLLKVCRGKIDGARTRVERINASLDGTEEAELEPFDEAEAEDASAAKPASKARRSSSKPKAEEASDEDEIRLF